MKEQNLKHVWLDVRPLGEKMISEHFPTIRARCLEEGYDLLRQPIPIVPAQHYFMGGIAVNGKGETSMRACLRRGDRLQRRTRQKPLGEQFAFGKPDLGETGGGNDGFKRRFRFYARR